MKKLDLHIHTISTISDRDFHFSLDKLKEYVISCKIDAIAITNHNCFDKCQYENIERELKGICKVFPGIEINIGQNAGHLICVTDSEDVYDFEGKCCKINEKIKTPKDSINFEELDQIFGNLSKYLWIPHYDKKPAVDKNLLKKMSDVIFCGEVASVKKFIYCQKNKDELTPVYFSDYRPTDADLEFPVRQSYFDIDELTIQSIKHCLLDRNKVTLSSEDGNERFEALPGLPLSTGLNVIVGGRSSGKSYTLDKLMNAYPGTKYIKQFELLETDPEKAAKDFKSRIATKKKSITEEYFEEFANVVSDIKSISLDADDKELDKFVKSLLKHAQEADRADQFSKCKLYSEGAFSIVELDTLEQLINSVEILLEAREYKDIINKHIERNSLIALYKDLIHKYNHQKTVNLKKQWVNELVNDIKNSLQSRTAATRVSDINLYDLAMDKKKVEKFNTIVNNLKRETSIDTTEFGGFKIEIKKKKFSSASELKNVSGKRNTAFGEIFDLYNTQPYEFLKKLIEMEVIPDTDYYQYFANVEYRILNQYGYEVSGGERAEFNLLQQINDAYQYDMLLLDEPESSFDNIFLKNKVNNIIKEISKELPVVIVTHNNTVGESIKPDFIVHTERQINTGGVTYNRYFGLPSDKELHSSDGKVIKNLDVILDCLEAGEKAYNERRKDYEMLKN